eukprot:SAG31_NODE_3098_length_4678_cov_2.509282_6_plen_92_part_00
MRVIRQHPLLILLPKARRETGLHPQSPAVSSSSRIVGTRSIRAADTKPGTVVAQVERRWVLVCRAELGSGCDVPVLRWVRGVARVNRQRRA